MVELNDKRKLYGFMLGAVIGETVIGILLKILQQVEVNEHKFKHPYFLTLWFFIGQIFCMIFHKYEEMKLRNRFGREITCYPKIRKALAEGKRPYVSRYIIAIPAIMDVLRTVFFFIAIIYIPASVINMMGAFVVIVTTVINLLFLGKKYYRRHALGLALIISGLLGVSLSLIFEANQTHESTSTTLELVFGIGMMLLSAATQGLQFISEEMMMDRYYITPMRMIGWEGIWGTCLSIICLVILQFIPWSSSVCFNGVVEDSIFALKQASGSIFILVSLLLLGVSGFSMNILGVLISKYSTSAQRAATVQVRVVLIWIWFLWFNHYGTGEEFLWGELCGFITLAWGVLIFNSIITIPVFGLAPQPEKQKISYPKSIMLNDQNSTLFETSYERLSDSRNECYNSGYSTDV